MSAGRDPLHLQLRRQDPEYRQAEHPVDVSIGETSRILHGGRVTLAGYEVFVVHGAIPGLPGVDECLSLALVGVAPDSAAPLTALLLDKPPDVGTGVADRHLVHDSLPDTSHS